MPSFCRAFSEYQEYEGELLGRQVGGQVVTVQFEVHADGGRWGEVLPLWWEKAGRLGKMKHELSQS